MASNFCNNSTATSDETDLEMKYWSLRIITAALHEIAYANPPHPKVSESTVKQLRNLLFQIDFGVCKKHLKPECSLVMDAGIGNLESNLETRASDSLLIPNVGELTLEGQIVIKALISLSIQKLVNTVLKLWNIQRTDLAEKIQTSSSNDGSELKAAFDKLTTRLKEMKLEEDSLDRDIEETEYTRMQDILTYDKELMEVKEMMTELMGETLLKKKPQIMTSYIDHLRCQSQLMNTKIQCAKLKQQIDENPPELVDEFEKTYNELKATVDEREKRLHECKDKLSKYESLGPELLEIAKEFQSIEENIKTKEWVLQQLVSNDQSFDTSLL